MRYGGRRRKKYTVYEPDYKPFSGMSYKTVFSWRQVKIVAKKFGPGSEVIVSVLQPSGIASGISFWNDEDAFVYMPTTNPVKK